MGAKKTRPEVTFSSLSSRFLTFFDRFVRRGASSFLLPPGPLKSLSDPDVGTRNLWSTQFPSSQTSEGQYSSTGSEWIMLEGVVGVGVGVGKIMFMKYVQKNCSTSHSPQKT